MSTFLGLTVLQWMSFLGIPSVIGGISAIVKFCISCRKKNQEQFQSLDDKIKLLMSAMQAQMRKDLLADYYYYKNNGNWISSDHMKDWEDRYQVYHNLGENGVMDTKRADLLSMPNQPTIQIQTPIPQADGSN